MEHGVAVLTMNSPPVNGLSHALRSALWAAVERLEADPSVGAVVITGSAKAFSGGADIKEFGQPEALAEPNLPQLTQRMVAWSWPWPAITAWWLRRLHWVCPR
jgi:3-hydroxyacyl-CoA dehydrogenase